MKKSGVFLIAISFFLVVICSVASARDCDEVFTYHYQAPMDQEVVSALLKADISLDNLSPSELLHVVSSVAHHFEIEGTTISAMSFLSEPAVKNIIPVLDDETMVGLLTDKNHSDYFRHFLIDIYTYFHIQDGYDNKDKIKPLFDKLLCDADVNESTKSMLISYHGTFEGNEKNILVKVASETRDEKLLYSSLDRLASLDPGYVEESVLSLYENRGDRSVEFEKSLIYLMGNVINELGETCKAAELLYTEADRVLSDPKQAHLHDTFMLVIKDLRTEKAVASIAKHAENYHNDPVLHVIVYDNLDTIVRMVASGDYDKQKSALFLAEKAPMKEVSDAISGVALINPNVLSALNRINIQSAAALSGSEGRAVYRDGVIQTWVPGLDQWHAGIVYTDTGAIADRTVIHAPGPNQVSQIGSWSQFINGKSYIGRGTFSGANLSAVLGKAYELRNIPYIGFSITQQMEVKNNSYPLNYQFAKSDIALLRCDGIVEFAYEYYGYALCVSGVYWNITKWEVNGGNVAAHHILNGADPRTQYGKFPVH